MDGHQRGGDYGTSPWQVFHDGPPVKGASPAEIRFTAKGNALYAICLGWPDKDVVVRALGKSALPGGTIKAVSMLGSKDEVKWQQADGGLTLTVPRRPPCQHAFVYRIELGEGK